MTNIRHEIANRLNYEINRRNLSSGQISRLIGLSDDIVSGYLSGSRIIRFSEITMLCNKIGINPVRLVYSDTYPKSKLAFRNSDLRIQKFAAEVEDVFQLIKEYLNDIETPKMTRFQTGTYKRHDIISEAAAFAAKIQSELRTPEDFVSYYSIPIFPIKSDKIGFDAFLISHDKKAAICVNTAKTPQRIRFSIAHEIAHLLFDRNTEVPIDIFLPNLYWNKNISTNEVAEFFAYKFAQFYLIPYQEAFYIANKYPNLNLQDCQKLINEFQTSKDVLANVLFDIISCNQNISDCQTVYDEPVGDQFRRMDWESGQDKQISNRPGSMSFKNIRQTLEKLRVSRDAANIFHFLKKCKENITSLIKTQIDTFSEKVIMHIEEVLQIDLR